MTLLNEVKAIGGRYRWQISLRPVWRWMMTGIAVLFAMVALALAFAIWLRPSGQITVGRYPWAAAVDTYTHHAFIVNWGSNTVSMLDTATCHLVRTIPVGASPNAIAIDIRRHRAIVSNQASARGASQGSLVLIDTQSGHVLGVVTLAGRPLSIALDTNTGRGFVTLASGKVVVVDTATVKKLATIPGALGSSPAAMAIDDQRHRLFLTDHTGAVRVLSTWSGRVVHTFRSGRALFAIAVDRTTGHLFLSDRGMTPARVLMLNEKTGQLLRIASITPGLDPLRITVDERTNHVFILSRNTTNGMSGNITMLDARTGRLLGRTVVGDGPAAMVVDDVTGHVYVMNTNDNTLSVLNNRNGHLVQVIPVMPDPVLLALDASTHRVCVVGSGLPASVALAQQHNPSLLDRLWSLISRGPSGGIVRAFNTHTLR